MYRWIKKLHIYSGLLSFTGFTVWGIVGIWASFLPAPNERPRREPEIRSIEFRVDASASDQQVTDAMIAASGLPFIQLGRKAQPGLRRAVAGALSDTQWNAPDPSP